MQGRRVLHPAQDYCHFCLYHGSALAHGQEPTNGQCSRSDLSLHLYEWRGNLPFPLHFRIPEDRIGNHDHHAHQRRQVYDPSPYTMPETWSPPCNLWRDVRVPRWDTQMSPCTCVWQRPKECGCVQKWYHHELPHPFANGNIQAKVRSQRYYREPQHVSEEHYSDRVSDRPEPEKDSRHTRGYNGHCERKHVTFEDHNNRKICNHKDTNRPASPVKDHCNGTAAFFSTEVPQSKLGSFRTSGLKLPVNGIYGGEPKLGQLERSEVGGNQERGKSQRKSQGTVREKIKQVVTELEDVLSGLKQVQVEMKEVVQQIDILTQNIDLGEEAEGPANRLPQDPRHHDNPQGVVALVRNINGNAGSQQSDSALYDAKSWTVSRLSDHCLAADSLVASKTHPYPSACVHGLETVESAADSLNRTSVTETHRTKSTANGDCLRARPPSGKVKDPQPQRTRADRAAISEIPEPPFPLTPIVLAKTQRPPPYPQNGLVKTSHQDINHPPNDLRMHPLPGKQKQLNSTMV